MECVKSSDLQKCRYSHLYGLISLGINQGSSNVVYESVCWDKEKYQYIQTVDVVRLYPVYSEMSGVMK